MKKLFLALLVCISVLALFVSCGTEPRIKSFSVTVSDSCGIGTSTIIAQTYDSRLKAKASAMNGKRFTLSGGEYVVSINDDGYMIATYDDSLVYGFYSSGRPQKGTDNLQESYTLDYLCF